MIRFISLFAIVFLSFAALADDKPSVDDKPLADSAMEADARVLMKEIRCLVCQNQSIEDSNADLAVDLRNIVREHIAAGESHDEVKAYLVDRYGDWVLLKPPVRADTMALWLSPVIILLIIFTFVIISRKRNVAPSALSREEQDKLDKLIRGNDE